LNIKLTMLSLQLAEIYSSAQLFYFSLILIQVNFLCFFIKKTKTEERFIQK